MQWISVSLFLFLLLFSGAVSARQGCSVWVMPVGFGDYDTSSAIALDADGEINITCDPRIPYRVWLDQGMNLKGRFNPRKMFISWRGYALDYNLYRNSARTEVWGDGTNNTYVQRGIGTGAETRFIIYGRLPGGQNVAPGLYSDTVIVTVEW